MYHPILNKGKYPACGNGSVCPAAARIADHVKLEEKYDGMRKALLELFGARQAQARLNALVGSSSITYEGIMLGSQGRTGDAFECAEKCPNKYEKGMVYAACGPAGAERAKRQLAYLALFLKSSGLEIPEEIVAIDSSFKLGPEPTEDLVRTTCLKASLLALSIDSLDRNIAIAWATVLFSQGLYAEAGLLAAKAKKRDAESGLADEQARDRDLAVKCITELMVRAKGHFRENKQYQFPEYYSLVAEASIIMAEIGNHDEARRNAKLLAKRPALQGMVLARCDDIASKTRAWEIANSFLDKGKKAYAASEIFSILGDASNAALATLIEALLPNNRLLGPFAVLRAAKTCRVSLTLSTAACSKIAQSDFEQIVLEAKSSGDELFLGKLLDADRQRFYHAVESLKLQA